MRQEATLRVASFDPRVVSYHTLAAMIGLAATVIGIPLIPVAWFVARWYYTLYHKRLSCELTDRSLKVGRGLLFRVEKTIPLDKITDLAMHQGPLMRHMNLEGMRVETAGQSAGPGAALVSLVGIVDPRGFRDAVIEQRDIATERTGDRTAPAPASLETDTREVLAEIRDILGRIERQIDRQVDRRPDA